MPRTLRFRVVMMLLVAFLLSAGAFILAMNTVVTSSFQEIESSQVLRDVATVRGGIDQQVAEMSAAADVIGSQQGASVSGTLSGRTLSSLNVDFALVTSMNQGRVSQTFQDFRSGVSRVSATAETAALDRASPVHVVGAAGGDASGIVLMPGGPALVSARNLALASGGPTKRVVVGRYMGAAEAAALGSLAQVSVALVDPRNPGTLPIPAAAFGANAANKTGVLAIDSKTNLGWGSVGGLSGGTALVYAVTEPRPIMTQAAATLGYTRWGVSLLSLLVGLSIVVMLEGSVLHRLARLRESVIDFQDDGESLTPVVTTGSDEIADLAIALNTTLGKMKASEQAHKHDAQHDHLTGLANRRCLNEDAAKTLAQAAANGEKCTLVLLDLDGFKRINDELGHQVGDDVLVWFANHMRSSLRSDSTMCRLGGDEFAVLMPCTDREQAVVAIERLREATSQPDDNPCFGMADVNFSVGYAVFPDHGESLAMLSQCGDTDLYANKRGKSESHAEAV